MNLAELQEDMEDSKVTSEQKLYVLLKHKKSLSWYQNFQMYLIRFFNFDRNAWESDAKKWCVEHDHIYGDEPTQEQLEEYGDRGRFHKAFPEYTHSTDIFLRELWKKSSSNPKNWLRTAKGCGIAGAIVSVITFITSSIFLVIKGLLQIVANI